MALFKLALLTGSPAEERRGGGMQPRKPLQGTGGRQESLRAGFRNQPERALDRFNMNSAAFM